MSLVERKLEISNFKCFSKIEIPFGRLTLLCGRNSAGKSTVVQALLLHRMALNQLANRSKSVPLNAEPGLALGNADDVFHRGSKRRDLRDLTLTLADADSTSRFALSADASDSNCLHISRASRTINLTHLEPRRFLYLSAERIGPRARPGALSNLPLGKLTLAEDGSNLAEVFSRFERTKIRRELVHVDERHKGIHANRLLQRNVELWLSNIFGAIQLRAEPTGNYAPPILRLRRSESSDDWVIPTNFGFGVTYALPVIVGGLLMKSGSMLIVDSPEAHLHPAAQTEMAFFLAAVAASGVSVVMETHSDHVIDGVRLAVSKKYYGLSASSCIVLNVDRNEEGESIVSELHIRENGTLDRWPKGFFDQQTLNLRELASQNKHNA